MAAARPLVQVYGGKGEVVGQVTSPAVFGTPIRNDIVEYVQSNLRKNRRVPYSVAKWAGTQTSAESWGTGRAVARIPRVPGGGTHRAGQGAFGNMCRGGRMFAPTRIWRKWHRKININQKRYAVASALAASAVPALVMARGHQISQIPEVPLVIATDAVESLTKTKNALALLKVIKADADVERCKTVQRHTGKARLRNRAKKIKVGPLIITASRATTAHKAFRNMWGVQTINVFDLDILKLAPGGHLGRFIIWTQAAFEQLNNIFGTTDKPSSIKKGYYLPRPIISNPDVRRVIQADTIQALVKTPKKFTPRTRKPNFTKNHRAMARINPYAAVTRNAENQRQKSAIAKKSKGKIYPKGSKKLDKKGKKELFAQRKAQHTNVVYAKYRKLLQGE